MLNDEVPSEKVAQARLELLEAQSILDDLAPRDNKSGQVTGDQRNTEAAAARDAEIAAIEARVAALRAEVGDPETVIDHCERLPNERRELLLDNFAEQRRSQVQSLREKIPNCGRT